MNSPRKRPGLLFTLVGPAAAGKNRLLKYILERTNVRQLPTATTRAPRLGEQEGREHFFVSRANFQHMIESDELLEHQVIHGNLYGMLRRKVELALDSGQSLIADIDVLGAERARAIYPDNVVSIFIQTPSIGILIERMRERRETEAEIGKRLLRVPMELAYLCDCEYVILNDSFERAADKLYQIVRTEQRGARHVIPSDPLVEYRYSFEAQIIPVCEDQALRRADASDALVTPFRDGEMPHQAALSGLRSEFQLDANESALISGDKLDGSYLPPVTLEYRRDESGEHVRYVYLYRLDERIAPAPGWAWMPLDSLPETLRAAVLESER